MGAAIQLAATVLSWAWNHKTLCALLMALAAIGWLRFDNRLLQARLTSVSEKYAMAQGDAERWHNAAQDRLARIATMSATLEKQNAEIEAARADNVRLDAVNRRYAGQIRAMRDQSKEIEHEARQHPEQDRALGAPACGVYRQLYGAANACTHPGAAAADGGQGPRPGEAPF